MSTNSNALDKKVQIALLCDSEYDNEVINVMSEGQENAYIKNIVKLRNQEVDEAWHDVENFQEDLHVDVSEDVLNRMDNNIFKFIAQETGFVQEKDTSNHSDKPEKTSNREIRLKHQSSLWSRARRIAPTVLSFAAGILAVLGVNALLGEREPMLSNGLGTVGPIEDATQQVSIYGLSEGSEAQIMAAQAQVYLSQGAFTDALDAVNEALQIEFQPKTDSASLLENQSCLASSDCKSLLLLRAKILTTRSTSQDKEEALEIYKKLL